MGFKSVEDERAYFQLYRKEHLEQIRANGRKYSHSDKAREGKRKWKAANLEKVRALDRLHAKRSRKRLHDFWGYLGRSQSGWRLKVEESERIGQKLLIREGYSVMRTNWHFPFDYLAKKDGKFYLAEATCNIVKALKPHQKRILDFLDWGLLVIFIKPDFSLYRIVQHEKGRSTTLLTSKSGMYGKLFYADPSTLIRILKPIQPGI